MAALKLKEPCCHDMSGLLLLECKGNAKCEGQFINWNGGAIVVGLCDLCHEGKPVCGPGR